MISELLGLETRIAAWVGDKYSPTPYTTTAASPPSTTHYHEYPPIAPHILDGDAMPLYTILAPLDRLFGQKLASVCCHTSTYGDVLPYAVAERGKYKKHRIVPKNIVPLK